MADTDLRAAARSLRELIESEADAVNDSLGMTPPVVDALVETGLFRLLVPRTLGGLEADPSTILDVCEELSYADGSVGWAFAQNTSVLGYAAYLDPELAQPLVQSRAGAGQFAPLGVCHKEEGGFRVSGHFQFGSGCGHADFMGGAGMEMHDGQPPEFVDGLPRIRAFIIPMERVLLKGNWDVMGLSGTGSFDYEVPEQFVDEGMTFSIFETSPTSGGALYGLGPVPLGTISTVAWAIGVAERALAEIVGIVTGGRMRMGSAPQREQQIFQRDLGSHAMALRSARLLAHDIYGSTVAAIERGEPKAALMDRIRQTRSAASYIAQICKAAATFAYEASGSHGLRNPSLLQRCFRDMHVGTAHLVFDERNYVEAVKARLGLEPLPF